MLIKLAKFKLLYLRQVYSDADIVLSSDWTPPITIAPATITTETTTTLSNADGRKKASSVSFSVDDNENSTGAEKGTTEVKKNKMLKRLSYPLSWVEGLTGEPGKSGDSDSAPTTSDSNQSVFSKVFSR